MNIAAPIILEIQAFDPPMALTQAEAEKFSKENYMSAHEAYHLAKNYCKLITGTEHGRISKALVVEGEFSFPLLPPKYILCPVKATM